MITFEFPLNERIRRLLRIEEIYQKFEIPSMKALIEIERNGVLIDAHLLGQQSQKIGEKATDGRVAQDQYRYASIN